LFVPPRCTSIRRLLVALKGSERGTAVLRLAHALARQVDAELRLLTVEPVYAGEPAELAMATPLTRSARIQSLVRETLGHELEVRRGHPAEQILEAITEHEPDALVVGCHRGGPAGVIEAGSTARHLIHTAPCAVLTVPL
jgi:nucleotide-binding universal stress UspA family protein